MSRQIAIWSKQYKASLTHDIPSMTKLMEWLPRHLPESEMVSVVHGDFRYSHSLGASLIFELVNLYDNTIGSLKALDTIGNCSK